MPTWDARNFLTRATLRRDKVTSFTDFPFSIPAIGGLDVLEFDRPVTFFVGENGAGKSTLLEAFAIGMGLNAEGGSRNFRFATRESHSGLSNCLRLARSVRRIRDSFFLRAESYFNVATEIEMLDREGGGPRIIDAYGGKSLHEQSHGESFFALFLNRLRGNGLYFFDEPEAALSPTRQLSLLVAPARPGEGRLAVLHRHPFADPDGLSGRGDPHVRERSAALDRVPRHRALRRDAHLPQRHRAHARHPARPQACPLGAQGTAEGVDTFFLI